MSTTTSKAKPRITLRFVRKGDQLALCRLVRRHGSEDFYSDEQVDALLSFAPIPGIVAVQGRLLLGCISWLPSMGTMNHELILGVVVHKSYRRRGIGRALLEAMWQRPAARQVPRLVAPARESDLDSQLFLKACGYECKNTLADGFQFPPETAYLFEKSHA